MNNTTTTTTTTTQTHHQAIHFNKLLNYAPAIKSLTKHLNTDDLKALSETCSLWWDVTKEAIGYRCSINMEKTNRVHPQRPYRAIKGIVYSQLCHDLPIEHLTWKYSDISPKHLSPFKRLRRLELIGCNLEPGLYGGIRELVFSLSYFETYKDVNLGAAVFPDLRCFEIKKNSRGDADETNQMLCTFIKNHPQLESFTMVSRSDSPECVLETLQANTKNLKSLELSFADGTGIYGRTFLTGSVVSKINKMTSIESLKLRMSCDVVNDIVLKNLHTFEMYGRCRLDMDSMDSWLPMSTKMKSFVLSFLDNPRVVLKPFAEKFPNLTRLELARRYDPIFCDKGVHNFPNLKSLSLDNVIGGLCNFKAPAIEELNLARQTLCQKEIKHIASGFPKINRLTLRGFKNREDMYNMMVALPHCTTMEFAEYTSYGLLHNQAEIATFLEIFSRHRGYKLARKPWTQEPYPFEKTVRFVSNEADPWLFYMYKATLDIPVINMPPITRLDNLLCSENIITKLADNLNWKSLSALSQVSRQWKCNTDKAIATRCRYPAKRSHRLSLAPYPSRRYSQLEKFKHPLVRKI